MFQFVLLQAWLNLRYPKTQIPITIPDAHKVSYKENELQKLARTLRELVN